MKKVITAVAVMAASLLQLCAAAPENEDNNVKALYQKYENNPAVTTVYVSSAMFDLLRSMNIAGTIQASGGDSTDVNTEELSHVFETVSSLTGLYILSTEDQAVASDMRRDVKVDGDYVQLMKVKDGGDKVDFYYKSPDGKRIVEFLMLADSDEETVVIQFESDSLTFDDVARLAAIMAQGE